MPELTSLSPFLVADPNRKEAYRCPPAVSELLRGQRLAVKDLFHIAGLPTSAGNIDWLTSHEIPSQTNSAVDNILRHGAEFVGKTITDELAYSLNGQNIHYGTPVNPLSPKRLPGGSSSGSAVAVSSNLADIGLGTDTGGSIRVPASYNGLFGLRPTHGVIECDNMVPLAPSFDTIGWMTRDLPLLSSVADILLPTEMNQAPAIKSPKLGVLTSFVNKVQHSDALRTYLSSLKTSFDLSDINDEFAYFGLSEAFRVLQGKEIWSTHSKWITDVQPNFAPDIQARFDMCKGITDSEVTHAKKTQQSLKQKMNDLFDHFDLILLPTTPGLAPLLQSTADELVAYRNQLLNMTAIAGLCGLPQLHLPLFTMQEGTCGLSILGKQGSDKQLISLAAEFMEYT